MHNIKEIIEEYYQNKAFDKIIDVINSYEKKGYGLDEQLISQYIRALEKTRKFDEAYTFLKNYEKVNKTLPRGYFATMYYRCYHLEDAIRVLKENTEPLKDPFLLVKIYLMQGKIEEAKDELDKIIENHRNEIPKEEIDIYIKYIANYYTYGSFIETEYESFVKNGNKLEPGHIIFLKNKPQRTTFDPNDNDPKSENRPYMIWKIEGDKLYIFPVVASSKKDGYKLYSNKYRNSNVDRIVKEHLCSTTVDNVLTVNDKVTDEDYYMVLKYIFTALYFSQESDKKASEKFLKEINGEPNLHNLIKIIEPTTKKHHYYYIYDKKDDGFIIYELDNQNMLLSSTPEFLSKERIIYSIIKIDENTSNEILSQINWSKDESNKVKAR